MLSGSTPVESGRKDRDDFQHGLGQFLFKRGVLPLVENDHFHLLGLADGQDSLGPKP